MITTLRPYQDRWVQSVLDGFEHLSNRYPTGTLAICGQMPTGAGKTRSAIPLLKRFLSQGKRVAFVAALEELIDDAAANLRREGIWCGIIKAGRPSDPLCKAQVCSLQTLVSRPNEIPTCDFVILDESHGAVARTPKELFQAWMPRYLLGLTATPLRADGAALRSMFQALCCGPSIDWLQRNGQCKICGHEGSAGPCGNCVLNSSELLGEIQPYLITPLCYSAQQFCEKNPIMDPLDAYNQYLKGKRVIVFDQSVKQAEILAERFKIEGISAQCIHGFTDKDIRSTCREELTKGSLQVLTGVDVFTQGWDCPAIEGIIFARKFTSLTPWLQSWGRGMRPFGDKKRIIGVDLWGSFWLHLWPHPSTTFAWNLDGKKVTPDSAPRVPRCQECFAINKSSASICYICQAPLITHREAAKVKKKNAIEVSSIPDKAKDYAWLDMMYKKCVKVIIPAVKRKGQKVDDDHRYALAWSYRRFVEQFGRDPAQ